MNEYSFIILKEGQPITADLLKEKLPPDTPIDELVTYLKQNKVCKKKDGECSYVGVVEWRQNLLCFFPKYYDVTGIKTADWAQPEGVISADYQHFQAVLQTIRKYHREEANNTSIRELSFKTRADLDVEWGYSGKLVIAVQLIDDYLENGRYTNMKTYDQRCGTGEIDWQRTITTEFPVISHGRPCYVDYWTRERVSHSETLIARVHEAIVADCTNRLARCGLADLLDIPLPFLGEGEDLNDFGDTQALLSIIEKEMAIQFVTSKQTILKLMHRYVELTTQVEANDDGASMYGTSSFHAVWEKVCGRVFGNQLEEVVPTTYLEGLSFDSGTKWSEIESRSLWSIGDKEEQLDDIKDDEREGTKLRPDFVALDKEEKTLYILDAKYYVPDFNSKRMTGLPGVGDINKQHLYQVAYHSLIKRNGWRLVNALLMPDRMPKALNIQAISVRCSLFRENKIQDVDGVIFKLVPIQTVLLNPETLFKNYLNDDRTYLENPLLKTLEPMEALNKR